MSSSDSSSSGADIQRSFQCVFIPADSSKAPEEWTITYKNATEVSCLMDRLKPHFASGGGSASDRESLRTAVRAQILEQMKKQGVSASARPVDDSMVDMVLQMSSVDCVPLQNNKQSTGFIGLMMYVDDQGKAKNLPVNERASRITTECGISTLVLGDCVIARNFDDENSFKRLDFTLPELEKEKDWKISARKANAERNASGQEEKVKQLQDLLSRTQGGKFASSAAASSAATTTAVKVCANPACEQDAHMRCSRCHRTAYCSRECQKAHFKFHKKMCAPPPPKQEQTATTTPATTTTTQDSTNASTATNATEATTTTSTPAPTATSS